MLWLPRKEYGEMCHAIRTLHANKIPKKGFLLYSNDLYGYTYDALEHIIECEWKIEIDGNEDKIGALIRRERGEKNFE